MLQHIAHLLLKQKEIAPCNVSYSFSNLCFVVSCIAVFICVEIVNARSAVSLLTSDSPDKFPTGRDKLGRTTGKYTTPLNQPPMQRICANLRSTSAFKLCVFV